MAGGAAGAARGGEGAHAAQRRAGAAAAGAAVGARSTRRIDSTPTRGARRWQISSADARSSSSTTSCSGPTTRPDARPARRSPTGSTGSPSTSPTTTSRWRRCRARRSRSCRLTSSGWDGRFPGRRRPDSDFNADFSVALHRGAAARGRHRVQLPPREGADAQAARKRRRAGRPDRGHDRHRRAPRTRASGPA